MLLLLLLLALLLQVRPHWTLRAAGPAACQTHWLQWLLLLLQGRPTP
jgi:hypothetical protein